MSSRYRIIHGLVYEYQLFDMPADHEDMPYAKGGDYLTIAFLESGWTREKIENGLEGLARLRDQTGRDKLTLRAFKFWEDSKVMDMVGTIAKSTKRRLRHRLHSPVKHQRTSLERVFRLSFFFRGAEIERYIVKEH
ncbi:hypothetical protein MMC22_003284 [Lobaria immixta]|nr:hypothetical protein [Lobaria immixta]